jgi:hypothetical protein
MNLTSLTLVFRPGIYAELDRAVSTAPCREEIADGEAVKTASFV